MTENVKLKHFLRVFTQNVRKGGIVLLYRQCGRENVLKREVLSYFPSIDADNIKKCSLNVMGMTEKMFFNTLGRCMIFYSSEDGIDCKNLRAIAIQYNTVSIEYHRICIKH